LVRNAFIISSPFWLDSQIFRFGRRFASGAFPKSRTLLFLCIQQPESILCPRTNVGANLVFALEQKPESILLCPKMMLVHSPSDICLIPILEYIQK